MDAIRKIVEGCGGIVRVAEATGQTQSAVHKWGANGIPEKHWATLRELDPTILVARLHEVNEFARQRKALDASNEAAA